MYFNSSCRYFFGLFVFDFFQLLIHWASIVFDIRVVIELLNTSPSPDQDNNIVIMSQHRLAQIIIAVIGISAVVSIYLFAVALSEGNTTLSRSVKVLLFFLSILIAPLLPTVHFFYSLWNRDFHEELIKTFGPYGRQRLQAKKVKQQEREKELQNRIGNPEVSHHKAKKEEKSWTLVVDDAIENRRYYLNLLYFQGLIQSVPSCVLQIVACALSDSVSTLRIVSICVALVNLLSKIYPMLRSFDLTVFVCKYCFLAHDVFKTLFILHAIISTPRNFVSSDEDQILSWGSLDFNIFVSTWFILKIIFAASFLVFSVILVTIEWRKEYGNAGCSLNAVGGTIFMAVFFILLAAPAFLLLEHGFLSAFVLINHLFENDVVLGKPNGFIQILNDHHEFLWGGDQRTKIKEMTNWKKIFEKVHAFICAEVEQKERQKEEYERAVRRAAEVKEYAEPTATDNDDDDDSISPPTSDDDDKENADADVIFSKTNSAQQTSSIVTTNATAAAASAGPSATNNVITFQTTSSPKKRPIPHKRKKRRVIPVPTRTPLPALAVRRRRLLLNFNLYNEDSSIDKILHKFREFQEPETNDNDDDGDDSIIHTKTDGFIARVRHLIMLKKLRTILNLEFHENRDNRLKETVRNSALRLIRHFDDDIESVCRNQNINSEHQRPVYFKLHHLGNDQLDNLSILDLFGLFIPADKKKSDNNNNTYNNESDEQPLTVTDVTYADALNFYLEKIMRTTLLEPFTKAVFGISFCIWFLGGIYNMFVFPIAFAALYFDKLPTLLFILWLGWSITLIPSLILTPSFLRYHLSCLVRQQAGLLFKKTNYFRDTYFSIPVKVLRPIIIGTDQVLPRECFDQHVAPFLVQDHLFPTKNKFGSDTDYNQTSSIQEEQFREIDKLLR